MRTPRPAVAAALVFGVLLGCGSTATHPRAVPTPPRPSGEAGKPAATVIADARKALMAATSVRTTGTFVLTGVPVPQVQRIDLRLTRLNGAPAATGTVTTVTRTTAKNGVKVSTVSLTIIRLGKTLYVRGTPNWYASIGPKAAAVAGHWLALPISQDKAVADLTDLSVVAAGFSATSLARVRGLAMIGATRVVDVMAGVETTLYVAATGPARPIRIKRSLDVPASANGTLDFGGYDAPVKVTAPAGAIPIAKVRG